ncbi:hypothetical protein PZ895_14060 [Mesorhizobium sp. YIM 152430]|nr:hypothetical protein [Mesorhizobium sp. YIM 152430]MDF1600888.1 hypothetical protein [Mesorhizobium sp. YIM 152430]
MSRIRHLWRYHDPGGTERRKEIYAAYELDEARHDARRIPIKVELAE